MSRNAEACGRHVVLHSCAFAKRRRFSDVCQAHDTRRRKFSLYGCVCPEAAATQRLLGVFDGFLETLVQIDLIVCLTEYDKFVNTLGDLIIN